MRIKELENSTYIHNVDANLTNSATRTDRLKTAHRLHLNGYTIENAALKTFHGGDDESENLLRWTKSVMYYVETLN